MKFLIFFAAFLFSTNALASWQLMARADRDNPYKLPAMTKMPNMSVACSEDGFSVKYIRVADQAYSGVKTFISTGEFQSVEFAQDSLLSHPTLDNDGLTLFAHHQNMSFEGVYYLDGPATKKFPLNKNISNAAYLSSPALWRGQLISRVRDPRGHLALVHGGQTLLSTMGKGKELIFEPSVRADQLVVKVRDHQGGSVIYSYYNGQKIQVTEDQKFNEQSPFKSFDNSPQAAGDGGYVFIADHVTFGRSVWYGKARQYALVAHIDQFEVSDIDYFAAQANQKGDVIFRGKDSKGKQAVFYWSAHMPIGVDILMREGQKLILNDGMTGRVISREKWPSFSGRPCLTDSGKIYIHAVLESGDGAENYGSGIFKR